MKKSQNKKGSKAQKASVRQGKSLIPRQLNVNAGQEGNAHMSSYFRFKAGSTPSSVVIEGRDLCAVALTASSATPATYVSSTFPVQVSTASVGPLCTRWGTYMALFQRWRVRKLWARFASSTATTTVGSCYLTFGYDSDTTPATAQAIMRMNGAVMGSAYADLSARYDPAVQVKWYPTNISGATDAITPGVLCFGTDSFTTSVVPGKLVIDYELEFAEPI